MINQQAVDAVNHSVFSKEFCKPLYGSYCFSQIPATVQRLFGIPTGKGLPLDTTGGSNKQYDTVILLLIDAFGWRFFERYREKFPFLQRFLASKITSQFPSTTAPHVTCIHTGLPVGQSGVYEWFCYEPRVDGMIVPLLFSFAGSKAIGNLEQAGVSPEEIYPTKTFYQALKTQGISSYVFQEEGISHSHYSSVMLRGAQVCPYEDFPQGLSLLMELLSQKRDTPRYYSLYVGDIDSAGHRHGVHSEEFEEAVSLCLLSLEEKLGSFLDKNRGNVACLVTADHGMIEVDPHKTFYINEQLPEIKSLLQRNRKGECLVPAGSCRDFFLHLHPKRLDEAKALLEHALKERAEVYQVQDLVAQGFFGEEAPSARFLERVGNLVILARGNEGIWWHDRPRFSQHFYGAHGGLSRAEMETIFLFSG